MNDLLTREQLAELTEKHRNYQYQAEAVSQQLNMVNITIKDVDTALITISALINEPQQKETLVPIGFGSFVRANLLNPDVIIVGIGAGVSIEKKIDDAKSFLEKRKEELTKYNEQLNTTMSKLAQELQNIEKIAQKHQQQLQQQAKHQQQQQPMRAE